VVWWFSVWGNPFEIMRVEFLRSPEVLEPIQPSIIRDTCPQINSSIFQCQKFKSFKVCRGEEIFQSVKVMECRVNGNREFGSQKFESFENVR
jgi:hypothetical protein